MVHFIVSLLILFSFHIEAQSLRAFAVFDVRKSLPLTGKEGTFRDYYVNLGTDNGAKVGSILSVKRRLPVIDVYRNQAQGDLVVEIAKLKVIHSQASMSVGRIVSLVNPKSIPVVQYESVMMGDQVELTATAEDAPAEEAKRDQASVKKKKKKAPNVVKVKVLNPLRDTATIAIAPKPVVQTNPEAATGKVAVAVPPAPAPAHDEKK